MSGFHYLLAEACQNTFVLVDLLHEFQLSLSHKKQIHEYLISTDRDDAIILIRGKPQQDKLFQVDMMVLGVDGQLGAFCGNGARACAAYLFEYYSTFKRFLIHHPVINYELFKYSRQIYAVRLPAINFVPDAYFKGPKIQCEGIYATYTLHGQTFYYADATEPHLILQANIEDDDLSELARDINQDRSSFPLGINVTAYYVKSANHLGAKTYERGVQRVTQSCGTGAACAAVFYLNEDEGIITIDNPGGRLVITHRYGLLELKGPASLL